MNPSISSASATSQCCLTMSLSWTEYVYFEKSIWKQATSSV